MPPRPIPLSLLLREERADAAAGGVRARGRAQLRKPDRGRRGAGGRRPEGWAPAAGCSTPRAPTRRAVGLFGLAQSGSVAVLADQPAAGDAAAAALAAGGRRDRSGARRERARRAAAARSARAAARGSARLATGSRRALRRARNLRERPERGAGSRRRCAIWRTRSSPSRPPSARACRPGRARSSPPSPISTSTASCSGCSGRSRAGGPFHENLLLHPQELFPRMLESRARACW